MTETLALASIQGFVVRGYRLPSAGYLFLRIDDAARARALLAETTPDVLTADPWETKPESGINIAFTYAGLQALGVPGTSLAGFPDDFRRDAVNLDPEAFADAYRALLTKVQRDL